ncbi:MAG TPA: hypothetical protein VFK37_08155 [Bacillales bacterium]|nr:hypothetical protein [Bacillales bacterium]
MAKDKQTENFTPEQIEALSGGYKKTDNRIPEEKRKEFNLEKGDGQSTKRPQ